MTEAADSSLPSGHAATANTYGNWNAKLVFEAANGTTTTLAKTTYSVEPTWTSFEVTKTTALEKKQKFGITLMGLKNVYGVRKVKYRVYNSQGKKVAAVTATSKKSGKVYYAEVSLKKLKYKFDNYTIKATITDVKGKAVLLNIKFVCIA